MIFPFHAKDAACCCASTCAALPWNPCQIDREKAREFDRETFGDTCQTSAISYTHIEADHIREMWASY